MNTGYVYIDNTQMSEKFAVEILKKAYPKVPYEEIKESIRIVLGSENPRKTYKFWDIVISNYNTETDVSNL